MFLQKRYTSSLESYELNHCTLNKEWVYNFTFVFSWEEFSSLKAQIIELKPTSIYFILVIDFKCFFYLLGF